MTAVEAPGRHPDDTDATRWEAGQKVGSEQQPFCMHFACNVIADETATSATIEDSQEREVVESRRRAALVGAVAGWALVPWFLLIDPIAGFRTLQPEVEAPAHDAVDFDAGHHWGRFPTSARRQMLWWVKSAAKDQTRARRLTAIVTEAKTGRRVAD